MRDGFQKMNFDISLSDAQKEKTRELCAQLEKDPDVAYLIQHKGVPASLIQQYPWRIHDWCQGIAACHNCKGLDHCRQKKTGYYDDLMYDGILQKVVSPCRFMKEKLKQEEHLQYFLINDMPKQLRTVGFASIAADGEDGAYVSVLAACMEAFRGQTGVYLYGHMGTGKTYLAAAACNDTARRKQKCAFVYWPDCVQRMVTGIDSGEYRIELERLKFVPFLVIDDIGAEAVTQWNRDQILLPVLNARYEAHLPTWFTSNEDIASLRAHFAISSRGKEEAMKANRIIERIQAMCSVKALEGKDRRQMVDGTVYDARIKGEIGG